MKSKSILYNVILVLLILVFLNLVSLSIFTRIDLSKGKIYSLSKASKKTVHELEDRLVIKAYFSKNLPGEYADSRRYTQDLLSEYQAYSRGKLRFEFIDPSDEETLKQEASKNQISPVPMRIIEKDKWEMREVYMGLAFLYQDKTESIPLIQSTQGLEYEITRMIKKITAQGLKKVAFFQPEEEIQPPTIQGMPSQSEEFSTIRQLIAESYELSTTDLSSKIDPSVQTLFFAGIKDSLGMDQLYNLDQFVMRGGNVLFFQDRVEADLQNQSAKLIESNLFDLLHHYGIQVKSNLVADAQCGQVQIQRMQGFFRMMTPLSYPYFPIVTNVNKDNLIVKNLDQLQMIFTSELDSTRVGENLEFEPLIFSSENSGEAKAPRFDISVNQFMQANLKQMFMDEPKVLAGIYSGSFRSYFADSDLYPDALTENSDAKILFVPDREFIEDAGAASVQGNLDFVLNAVDFMAAESTLIEIRSRETIFKPLKELDNTARKTVKWLNILLPSILLIVFGMIRYRNELKRRKIIGELYE